jgi:hypothetical protein
LLNELAGVRLRAPWSGGEHKEFQRQRGANALGVAAEVETGFSILLRR